NSRDLRPWLKYAAAPRLGFRPPMVSYSANPYSADSHPRSADLPDARRAVWGNRVAARTKANGTLMIFADPQQSSRPIQTTAISLLSLRAASAARRKSDCKYCNGPQPTQSDHARCLCLRRRGAWFAFRARGVAG